MGKSLIPTGYMPDASASAGRFAITFCTANGGPVNLTIDAPDHDDSGSQASGLDCPYGMSGAQDLIASHGTATLAATLQYRDVIAPIYRALPALPAQGPPLGSRAPPLNLG